MIRVNSVHPTTVGTDMVQKDAMYALFALGWRSRTAPGDG
jgi:NAD(P)-dependent dehydrogenase (short-subunit alcohol dehydrogenase family)